MPALLYGLLTYVKRVDVTVQQETLTKTTAKVESVIREGGSRISASSGGGAGGRDVAQFAKAAGGSEFPGQGSALIVQKWAPSRSTKRDAAPLSTSAAGPQHHEAIFRKVRGILNKLTPEKFDKLCLELLNVGIDSKFILKGIILLIFEKALEEPKYSSLYAQLCLRLAEDAPNFDGPPLEGTERHKQTSSFRKLLIAKLQDEFENRSKKLEVFESHEGPLSAEDEEQRTIAKLKMLGNIKFIGELGKLELLHESILHRCIKTLLDKKKRVALKEIGEDLECLCQILRTVGPQLDHDKARLLMDQYFERMRALMINKELPSRIRFLLQDTVELRENMWQPRKAFSDNGPKLISQIRQDAVKDLGVYIPSPYSSSNHRSDLFPDDPFVLWGGAMGGMARRPQYSLGGLSDVFSQMGRELGTGPGVIQSRYSPPMGRHRTGQLFNGYGSHMTAGPAQFGDKGFSRQLGPGLFNMPGPPIPGSGKELPSRFGKKGALNLDEISLRPAQSFLLSRNQTSKLQSQIPTMMPPSAQPPPTQMPPSQAPSLGLKSAPPPIQEKPPKKEKKVPTRDELLKMTDGLIEELYGEGSVEAATTGLKELPAPRPLLPELLAHILASSLERPDEERERACVLLETLQKDEVINGELFVKAFSALLDRCGELESTVPQVKSCAAQLAARAVASGLVGLAEVAGPLKNGQHFPLLLLCLQQLARLRDPDWLADTFQASRINMTKMLPECDQSAERMVEILEEKGLAFLFPLLHVERELSRHLQSDPSPPAFYKWVKENVSTRLHGDRAFINILVTCLLHFITGETSLADGFDPTVAPNRDVMEREKQLLDSFQPVLCRFLHGRVPLQLSALYALQVHCHQHCFPKGMLLRWFIALYDLEVVEEEAFLAWKEDLTQEFPGKGKALFQVNQWLTWLETAEEDESEEEDDDAD